MGDVNIGHSVPISLSIQREERMNHDKTQQLMRQLKEIEKYKLNIFINITKRFSSSFFVNYMTVFET